MARKRTSNIAKIYDVLILKAGTIPDCIHHEYVTASDMDNDVMVGVCQKCEQIREYRRLPPDKQKFVFRIGEAPDENNSYEG